MKVVIIGCLPESLLNFRGELIRTLVENDYQVLAISADANETIIHRIESMGCRFLSFPIERSGLNPLSDLKAFFALYKVFKSEKPDLILSYTIKPVIWGGLAAQFSGVKSFYALVTGLGFAFQKGSPLKNLLMIVVKGLYRSALKDAKGIIFQNKDNKQVFIDNSIVDIKRCSVVNGSGVDLSSFTKNPLSQDNSFLLIARLLGDKGIREYALAAKIIKKKYPSAVFNLVGPEDPSPDGIPLKEVLAWHDSGIINYHGGANDVRPYIEKANIFVLPSYHEGMPRTVLEAMAMGRPILTTNVPGCKETVINGKNGWLVEKANADALAQRMIWFIENQGEWQRMGDKSHEMAVEKFDVHKVNQELLKIMGLVK